MPRVNFVKAARKANPVAEVGESYYWWKFRYGGKHYSKTHPKASQLTQSEYLSTVLSLSESLDEQTVESADELETLRDDISSQLRELGEECNDRKEGMPESLQYGPTGELLEERYYACDGAADNIESVDLDFESDLDEDDEEIDDEDRAQELRDWLEEQKSEIQQYIEECNI